LLFSRLYGQSLYQVFTLTTCPKNGGNFIQGFFDPDKPTPDLTAFKEFTSRAIHGLMGVGHAVQNVLLAATLRGLGVGYVGTFDPPPPPDFERALSIEKPFCLLMILPIGYPAEKRPSLSKVISKIVKIIE